MIPIVTFRKSAVAAAVTSLHVANLWSFILPLFDESLHGRVHPLRVGAVTGIILWALSAFVVEVQAALADAQLDDLLKFMNLKVGDFQLLPKLLRPGATAVAVNLGVLKIAPELLDVVLRLGVPKTVTLLSLESASMRMAAGANHLLLLFAKDLLSPYAAY
jgi:hypothetical protein